VSAHNGIEARAVCPHIKDVFLGESFSQSNFFGFAENFKEKVSLGADASSRDGR
jgi:hypothetical protein